MRRRVLLFLVCALGLAAAPSTASAAGLYVPGRQPVPSRPFAAPIRDAVLDARGTRASAARAPASMAQAQTYLAQDGQPVRVGVSDALQGATPDAVQGYVNFLGSRLHGLELRRLTVFILTGAEIREECSEAALACYIPRLELMVIPGEQTPSGEVPVEYVITHEYGHHIAANRDNDPWSAVAWGPKAWATTEQVCAGVATNRYFPGDQADNYVRNPGENWAEVYAQLQYRDQVPWQYDPSLTPDEAAFAAVVRDVTTPWTMNVAVRRSGRLSSRRQTKTFPVTTTLDGRVKLSLSGPRRSEFDVQIIDDGEVVAGSRRSGSRDTLTATDCAVRSFQVRVVRRSGSGSFSLRVQTPG